MHVLSILCNNFEVNFLKDLFRVHVNKLFIDI